MRSMFACVTLLCLLAVANAPAAPTLTLWRLDCGTIPVPDMKTLSDIGAFGGRSVVLTDSCYLIKHDESYLLWDAGLTAATKFTPERRHQGLAGIDSTLPEQLARIGVRPEQISILAISNYHVGHTGQAPFFPGATLLIGRGDLQALSANPPLNGANPTALAHWIGGPGKVDGVDGDRDIYGDASVVMIALPGHTSGNHGLLVRLGKVGTILLTGDAVRLRESYADVRSTGLPPGNLDRAASLASIERMHGLERNLKARIIIAHDARDISKLPAFPVAAE